MARKKTGRSEDADIVAECHKRFAKCESYESEARKRWKEDLRFANADPDNGDQWEDSRRKQRELEKRPCLTINKVKQHNRQITNDARQNKPSVRVYPVDDGADKKTAEIFNGIIRHIEANSNADTAYDTAGEFAVDAGLGYWRVTTDYAADNTFDQEIYIKAVKNPLNVYLDGYTEVDGCDATAGFVFEDMDKDEFEEKYPDCEPIGWPTDNGDTWLGRDTIRVCEYFKIIEKMETLIAQPDGNTIKLSDIPDPEMVKAIKADDTIKKRKVSVRTCKWYLIAGDKIIDRKDWAGKYIPIVRVIGEEIEIDGKIDRKGHTRSMKDAQRMYNFWTSSAVEFVALQGKQPYLAEAAAIQGYEAFWDNLNSSNLPYLPFNGRDAEGNQIAMPQRQQPPVMAQAYMQGMQVASEEMKMASGQYDASIGARSNETSGRAIMARQRQGDNATFHFIDNIARSIRYTGKILVDLIPKIYDTARVVRILGEDGNEDKAEINPEQREAVVKTRDSLTGEIKEIYNPNVGRYDVIVTVGPSYGTKRKESFDAMIELSGRNPQLMQVAGDLIMKASDMPMAEQLAERLEKTLPPGLLESNEDGPTPKEMALEQQVQQIGQALENAAGHVQQLENQLKDKDKELTIKAFAEDTKRLQAMSAGMTPEQIQLLVNQAVQAALMQPQPIPQEMQEPMQKMPPPDMQSMQTMQPMDQMEPMGQPPMMPGGMQ